MEWEKELSLQLLLKSHQIHKPGLIESKWEKTKTQLNGTKMPKLHSKQTTKLTKLHSKQTTKLTKMHWQKKAYLTKMHWKQ